jgi:hypothetical protein
VRGVVAAPAAVLAHLDAVRIVPAVLVRLVVATLAFLASERYRDSYFSASHFLRILAIGEAEPVGLQKEPRDPRGWPKG